MIIKQAVADAMNAQIESEFTAAAQYLAIAIYFEEEALPDLAAFFFRQSDEEREHALMFIRFMLETGAKPLIPAQDEVKNSFKDAAEAVGYALGQELKVTDQINNLVTVATTTNDHTSNQFLQWFVSEQVEEVDSMSTLLQTIKHANGNLLLVEEFVRRAAAQAAAAGE